MSEFDLIRRLQEIICIPPDSTIGGCVLGIGDDGAVLDVPPGQHLVVCTDNLVEGVHFPMQARAAAVGHKALAVNLSDLAAMGADPAWFFMNLTLPSADPGWLDSFARGMAQLARKTRIYLAGGDVSSGSLAVTVTALGLVPQRQALTRSGAAAGDLVVVSGKPGAAAHALQALQAGDTPSEADLAALEFPEARLDLGRALRGLATSCIDLSDGLSADLGHILQQSGVGAELELSRLPIPDSLVDREEEDRWLLQLAGGDDYELCFTVSPAAGNRLGRLAEAGGVALTVIGTVREQPGLSLLRPDGRPFVPAHYGYEHFAADGGAGR